jgi:hypothetical protein
MAETPKLYPHFVVENNKHPKKLYAFPFLGFIVKIAFILPILLWIFLLGCAALVLLVINWFYVLFTGKYWNTAYKFFLGFLRLNTKVKLFAYGITDKYPGFRMDTKGLFTLEMEKPEKPNRWLSIPLIGICVRFILLIPYLIFSGVLGRGSQLALLISWFAVLFKGRFPESLYEFERDTMRVSMAANMYMIGLSDKYPSFWISMDHQTAKLLLIIAGALMSYSSWPDAPDRAYNMDQQYEYGPFTEEDSTSEDFQPKPFYREQTAPPQQNTY